MCFLCECEEHYYNGNVFLTYSGPDFSSYLPRFVDGLVDNNCIFDYLKDWESGIKTADNLNACVICYENLHKEPIKELQKLAKFLDREYPEEFLEKVHKATTFDSLLQSKEILHKDKDGPIMYRKGKVGDWKNHFNVAESEWFDHVVRTRMGGRDMFPENTICHPERIL